jgi:co-chaperonin GroES (HSP10)
MAEKKLAFEPHTISKTKFKALNDTVIVSDMRFEERVTSGGIILTNDNGKGYGIRPRWGRVYAIGPEQKDVSVGDWIMVEHGRWTRGLDIVDEQGKHTIRKIDPRDILLISNDEECPQDDTQSTAVHVDRKDRY